MRFRSNGPTDWCRIDRYYRPILGAVAFWWGWPWPVLTTGRWLPRSGLLESGDELAC